MSELSQSSVREHIHSSGQSLCRTAAGQEGKQELSEVERTLNGA